mmetsp:Transcript_61503/g.181755  ORF Transcript_61503/g.181755 Transcript_61503/m.181755 type:complete len:203 (+) Transcript_61503:204-812(+)
MKRGMKGREPHCGRYDSPGFPHSGQVHSLGQPAEHSLMTRRKFGGGHARRNRSESKRRTNHFARGDRRAHTGGNEFPPRVDVSFSEPSSPPGERRRALRARRKRARARHALPRRPREYPLLRQPPATECLKIMGWTATFVLSGRVRGRKAGRALSRAYLNDAGGRTATIHSMDSRTSSVSVQNRVFEVALKCSLLLHQLFAT